MTAADHAMDKYVIKVVKRSKENGTKKIAVVVTAANAERRDLREAAGIVNDWISQSRENSRIERLFSQSTISSWKELAPTIAKVPA